MFLMRVGDKCCNKLEATGWGLPPPSLTPSEAASSRLWTWGRERTTSHSTRPQKVLDSYPLESFVLEILLDLRDWISEPSPPAPCVDLSRHHYAVGNSVCLPHLVINPRETRAVCVFFSTLFPAYYLMQGRGAVFVRWMNGWWKGKQERYSEL